MDITTAHDHSLDAIVGYLVQLTRDCDGNVLGSKGPIVDTLDGPARYAEALDITYGARANGAWAIVHKVYRCGCDSRNF